MLSILLVLLLSVITIGYYFLKRPHQYWKEKGVDQGSPTLLFGDNLGPLIGTEGFTDVLIRIYNVSKTARYTGMYQFLHPILIVRDTELIKQILVKDFDHFVDHYTFVPQDVDPLWGNNLFALTGSKWRDMRTLVSPAFTSSKMKFMFGLMLKNGERFVDYFVKKDQDLIQIEMKDNFTRFANDVIANTAFGFECDSLTDPNNEFYLMGKEATDFSGFFKNLKFVLYLILPMLARLLEVSIFSKKVSTFFYKVIKSNIQSREEQGIVRPDMIHLLLEARKGLLKQEESQPEDSFAVVEESSNVLNTKFQKPEITDEIIASQAVVFFFAGFDTISALMCFMSHELAINPEIQSKLIEEIDATFQQCNGTITYEALLGMKYLDMVICEALRKWPINVALDRVCTKPYIIEAVRPEENPIHLKTYDMVWIPVFAIHRDPEIYPEPEKFDPERFNDENKRTINPYTYLPFGYGPRVCVGSRYAMMETKILFFYLLSKFEIVPIEKTQIPLQLKKSQFSLASDKGFWLGLKRRVN